MPRSSSPPGAGQFEALQASVADIGQALLSDDGPFPERLHVNALGGRLVLEYATMLRRWAAWAEREVESWPDVGPEAASLGRAVGGQTVRRP